MTYNFSSFNLSDGTVTAGVRLITGKRKSGSSGDVFAPHIQIGQHFIQCDRWREPAYDEETQLLHAASLKRIVVQRNERSYDYYLLAPQFVAESTLYLHISDTVSDDLSPGDDSMQVGAWVGVKGSPHTEAVHADVVQNAYLFAFYQTGAEIEVYCADGRVYSIKREGGELRARLCNPAETAYKRTEVCLEQLATSATKPMVAFDPIVQLLLHSTDGTAMSVYADFLTAHKAQVTLTPKQRESIYDRLTAYKRSAAVAFAPRQRRMIITTKTNVISIPLPAPVHVRARHRTGSDQ